MGAPQPRRLEAAHALLRGGGRLGFIIPSGLYSDNGTGALRRLFLERCRWEWLFGIENRDKVFPIHRSYKFNPVIVEKGGATEAIRTTFMRRNLDDSERAEELSRLIPRRRSNGSVPGAGPFLKSSRSAIWRFWRRSTPIPYSWAMTGRMGGGSVRPESST